MRKGIFVILSLALGMGCSKSSRFVYRRSTVESLDNRSASSNQGRPAKKSLLVAPKPMGVVDSQVAQKEGAKPARALSDRTQLRRQMIIYSGDLSVGVFDPERSVNQCLALTKKYGGYLKSRSNNAIVVRIPAPKFFTFVDEMENFGKVTSRTVNSQDVTAEFVDLSLRLNNLIAARDRLKVILSRATKVKETLAIEKELTRVTGSIEQLKGRLRYIQNLVSYATVHVRFYARHAASSFASSKLMIRTPIHWVRSFDIISLFRN